MAPSPPCPSMRADTDLRRCVMLRGCVGLIDSASVLLPDLLLATPLTPSTASLTPSTASLTSSTAPLTSSPFLTPTPLTPTPPLTPSTPPLTPSTTSLTSSPFLTPTPLTPSTPLTSNPYAPVSSLLNHTSYTPSATAYTSHPHYTPTSSTRLQIISNGYDCNRPRAKRVLQYVQ